MAKKSEAFDYRVKAQELEGILTSLQKPDIEIDEAMRLHTEGLKLIHDLELYLQQAEVMVKKHVADSE